MRFGWSATRSVATLLSWLLVAAVPVCAESLTIKNRSPLPVVVQAATVQGGMLLRDRAHLVQPNEATPGISLPGNKVLTIFDARNANRVLIQVPVAAGNEDQLFEVNPDPNSPTGVRLDRVPRR